MTLSDILQGKWLGHPVHPAVVHLPLATWIGAAVLDVAAQFGYTQPALVHLSLYAVILGLAGVLIAAPTGIADWLPIKKGKPARRLGLIHMVLNVAATVIFAVNLMLRLDRLNEVDPISNAVAATSGLGAVLLVVSGYIGSLMVFDYGVSVARLSKKKWRAEAAKSGGNLPPEK